jgi:hypothetical protein
MPICLPASSQTLSRLGVQWDKKTRAIRVPPDLFGNLVSAGSIEIVTSTGGESKADGEAKPPEAAPARLGFDVASAQAFWRNNVFGKTFVERRSLFSMYR